MSCIVNPDLCPTGQISESCKDGINQLCGPIHWNEPDAIGTFLTCIKTNAAQLKGKPWNCYDLEKLPSCLECSLFTIDKILPNLGRFCNSFSSLPLGGMGQTACENAIPPSGPPSCCKWIGPTCGNTNCKVGQKCCAGNKCDYSCGGGGGGGGSTLISGVRIISIVGGLLFTLVIGVVIWLIVRKKSK